MTAITISKPLASDPLSVYTSFFLSQFTADPPPEALVMIDSCRRYLGLLLSPSPSDGGGHPLGHAAEALVTNYFGKINASRQLVHDSIGPYVRALKSLSAKLAYIQRVGISYLEEEEVMQLLFACLFLSFWELAMNPQSTAWQKHVRGLANIIKWRGPQGFKSPRSLQVITLVRLFILLESISSKQPTFLSEQKWQRFRDFRPRLLPWSPAPILDAADSGDAADTAAERTPAGPKHYLDFILDHLVIVSNLTAEFANGLRHITNTLNSSRSMGSAFERIQAESQAALERLETVLAHMMANISGGALPADATIMAQNSTQKGPLWGKPLEYNLASLCRTAAITLRLLMCDLIEEQHLLGEADGHDHDLEEHRAALIAHVETIVAMIPYSSHGDIFGVAPLCFVPAFRIAEVVLARESNALRAGGGGRDAEAERCVAMGGLIQRHLDFVASRKIPIKVDI